MSGSDYKTKFCNKCNCETERYASGKCKACVKAYNKKWWSENETYAAAYRADNQESALAAQKKYKSTHKSEIAIKTKADRVKNPEKYSAYSRKHYNLNRSVVLQKSRDWKAKNAERVREQQSLWNSLNSEAVRLYAAKRRALYPFLMRTYSQNRRSRKIKNGGVLSAGLVESLLKLQKGKCACCKQPLGDNYHLDHIMPLALGGSNTDDNMQLLRSRCNLQKQATHPVDFMQRRGFLL